MQMTKRQILSYFVETYRDEELVQYGRNTDDSIMLFDMSNRPSDQQWVVVELIEHYLNDNLYVGFQRESDNELFDFNDEILTELRIAK